MMAGASSGFLCCSPLSKPPDNQSEPIQLTPQPTNKQSHFHVSLLHGPDSGGGSACLCIYLFIFVTRRFEVND